MLDAVMATYEGENTFILDEATPFSHGQRVMIAAVEPRHIECFDNSNLQGTNPVSSCVVFRDGKPYKNTIETLRPGSPDCDI